MHHDAFSPEAEDHYIHEGRKINKCHECTACKTLKKKKIV
jgi:hypothetical protein